MFEKQEETKTANDIRLLKCRTCLQELGANSIGIDLFQSWVQPLERIESTIADDLAKLTNIQINQTDKYPKVICKFCCLKLQNACDFVSFVRKNDSILRESNINYCNKTIWPKAIQIDKNVNRVVYENVTDIKIKQELCECIGDKKESCGCNDFTELEIKIEPEEFIQENQSSDFEMTDSIQTTIAKCDITIESQNDQNKSNLNFLPDRAENKAAVAERSRLYRERHRKEINQRRRESRRHQQKLHQINTASMLDESMDVIKQYSAETNKKLNPQTRRQRRYYQRNREMINQRRRDQRKKQCKQKSQEIHVESNGQYRDKNRSNNKQHT